MVVVVGQGRKAQQENETKQIIYASRQVYDGRRMRKAPFQRKTVDYFSSVAKYLEVCFL
jgi:hypothetical protein